MTRTSALQGLADASLALERIERRHRGPGTEFLTGSPEDVEARFPTWGSGASRPRRRARDAFVDRAPPPRRVAAHANLAYALANTGRLNDSVLEFRRALELEKSAATKFRSSPPNWYSAHTNCLLSDLVDARQETPFMRTIRTHHAAHRRTIPGRCSQGAGRRRRRRAISPTSDGVKIHYPTAAGTSGSWVVLVHGYSDNAERNVVSRTGIAPVIAKHHRAVVPDNNHGKSDDRSLAAAAPGDVVELMDYLKIDRAHIRYFSMGGSITGQLLSDDSRPLHHSGLRRLGHARRPTHACALRHRPWTMRCQRRKATKSGDGPLPRARVAQSRPANFTADLCECAGGRSRIWNVPFSRSTGRSTAPSPRHSATVRRTVFENVILEGKTHLTAISVTAHRRSTSTPFRGFIDAYDKPGTAPVATHENADATTPGV